MICNVAFVLALVTLTSAQATVCKTDAECMSGECCYIQPEFMVVSKRDGQPMLMPAQLNTKHDTGVCEKYHALHTSCYPLEKANGHCGCPTNASCTFVPATLVTPPPDFVVSKRKRSIYMPGPGTFQCELK